MKLVLPALPSEAKKLIAAAVCAFALHAQTAGSIVNRPIPVFGLTVIDAQQNTYVASGGFAGGIRCAPMNIAKFDPTGHQVFAFDGPGTCGVQSRFRDIAVDASGAVYTTGTLDTFSGQTIITRAFAAKLSADGSRFAYIANFPAALAIPYAIRIDASGNAYVAGATSDAHPFVIKLSPDGATLLYTTQLTDSGLVSALALNGAGDVYVTGQSGTNALVAKLDAAGKVAFATSFGGASGATGTAIALDAAANIYLAGDAGPDFPTTAGTYQPAAVVPPWNSGPTAYIAKVKPDGSSILWATYAIVNGNGSAQLAPLTLAATPSGETYLATGTGAGFLATASAPQPCFGLSFDVVLLHFNPQGALGDGTYLGLTQGQVTAMRVPGDGSVLIASYGDGGAVLSEVRFGDSGWTAAPCLSRDVLNAASFSSGQWTVSPGELVSLTGLGIGPDAGVAAQLDQNGRLPRTLGGVQVFFNGIAAPLLYVQSRQVNAQVPFEVNTSIFTAPPVDVTLTYAGHTFGPYAKESSWMGPPGIFRLHPGVSSQAAALNQDGTTNGPDNPAPRGSTVALFGTGYGPLVPPCATGGLNPDGAAPLFFTGTPIQIPVQYGGAAPTLLCGIDQFNAQIPLSVPPGPFLLTPYINPGYGVTIYVK